MILLSRLKGKQFVVNCELIKFIESTPDTLITLSTGEKLMVSETIDEVIDRTIEFRRSLYLNLPKTSRGDQ